MSLKIAVALILAVAVARSTAKPLKEASNVSGFTFQKGDLRLTASEGNVSFTPVVFNTTSWEYISNNDAKTIKQKAMLFGLSINYPNTVAKDGDKTTSGTFYFVSMNAIYYVTITATGDASKCNLDVKIEADDLNPAFLLTVDFGENAAAFDDEAVAKALKETVIKSLSDSLPKVATGLFKNAMPELVDEKQLCKDLVESDAQHYPEPYFLRFQ